jgi:hypothetical protein
MVVDLARFVLVLRRIRRCVRFLEKAIVQNERVRSLGSAVSRVARLIASPAADEELSLVTNKG